MLAVGSRQVVGCATRRAHKRQANKLGATNRRPSTIGNQGAQSHLTKGGGRRRLCDRDMSWAEPSPTWGRRTSQNRIPETVERALPKARDTQADDTERWLGSKTERRHRRHVDSTPARSRLIFWARLCWSAPPCKARWARGGGWLRWRRPVLLVSDTDRPAVHD